MVFIIGNADLKPFQVAKTSFSLTVRQAVDNNCLSTLELAQMASSFKNLHHFIEVSIAYCNSFLPDGISEEENIPTRRSRVRIRTNYGYGDDSICSQTPMAIRYAKHLTERFLFHRYPGLPILIVRPSCIGPAVSSPFPLYGPRSSTPSEQLFRLLTLNPGTAITHATEGLGSGTNIFATC